MSARPDVIIATTRQCPHCPAVKHLFQEFLQRNLINQLKIIDLESEPDFSQQYAIRSVPWVKIAELEFVGVHSRADYEYWATHVNDEVSIQKYVIEQLNTGGLNIIERLVKAHPNLLLASIPLLADTQAPIQARIGLTAIIEGIHDQDRLTRLLPRLSEYAQHADHRVRGDACHLLGRLTDPRVVPVLQAALNDPHEEVREIAAESLAARD